MKRFTEQERGRGRKKDLYGHLWEKRKKGEGARCDIGSAGQKKRETSQFHFFSARGMAGGGGKKRERKGRESWQGRHETQREKKKTVSSPSLVVREGEKKGERFLYPTPTVDEKKKKRREKKRGPHISHLKN